MRGSGAGILRFGFMLDSFLLGDGVRVVYSGYDQYFVYGRTHRCAPTDQGDRALWPEQSFDCLPKMGTFYALGAGFSTSLSMTMVTGPSLRRDTFMSAPN